MQFPLRPANRQSFLDVAENLLPLLEAETPDKKAAQQAMKPLQGEDCSHCVEAPDKIVATNAFKSMETLAKTMPLD